MTNDKLQLPVHLSARADQLRAEAIALRETMDPLADWFRRAEELIREVQATGLWNDETGTMVEEREEALGMAEVNDLYCDLVDAVRFRRSHDV